MIVVVKEPNKAAEVRDIKDDFKARQAIVGGLIEVIELINGLDLVCNEEFLFLDFEPNVCINGQTIYGTVFVTKADESGKFVSLSDHEVRTAMMILNRQAIKYERVTIGVRGGVAYLMDENPRVQVEILDFDNESE